MIKKESKYKKVVNYVISGIRSGKYGKGDWIPSINQFRTKFDLSRDTVFTGLSELKTQGIIDSKPGFGYYIISDKTGFKKNIFLLFNELNAFKEDLYRSFISKIGKDDVVDLYFHNYNRKVFETLVKDAVGNYTTYVLMPGKFTGIEELLAPISKRVYLLDHYHPELQGKFSAVAQNFEKDTYEALLDGYGSIRKYEKIIMVQSNEKEPDERFKGLNKFGTEKGFVIEHLPYITDAHRIKNKELYIVVDDKDLVNLIKSSEKKQLNLGVDYGIISYNDTLLKEILAGGITTLSTDFKKMGETMANLINHDTIINVENPWKLTIRNSI